MKKTVLFFCSVSLMTAISAADMQPQGTRNAVKRKSSAAQPESSKTSSPATTSSEKKPDTSFLLSGWQEKWPDGSLSGAVVTSSNQNLTISGSSLHNSYGSVWKKLNINLDKMPYLIVDIQSVNGFWYIIAKNAGLKEGFIKVQEDTQLHGKQIYDLKSITGLDQKRDLEIEIGVSSGKDDPNTGKSVVIKSLDFASIDPNLIRGVLSLSPWKERWMDGKPSGATVKDEPTGITIRGNSREQSYGLAYRIVSVNLDKTPIFRITPAKVNGVWYLEASGGALKAPVKIQTDTDSSETKTYDLKSVLGLSGVQNFELHFGVGSGSQELNDGKEVVFNKDMRFMPAAGENQ